MANCPQINNTTIIGTSAVTYDSTPLPCLGIQQCDGLNDILITLDTIICNVKEDVDILTDEVTNITEEVMLITEDIININNQLGICCPTTTTTSTTVAPTTTTTSTTANITTTTTTLIPTTTTTSTTSRLTTTTTSSSSTSTSSTTSTSTSSTSTTTSTTSTSTTSTTTTVYPYCPKAIVATNPKYWKGITTTPDGTIYACTLSGVVYKYPVGGPWSTVVSSGAINAAMAADSLGNVYGAVNGGTLYIKTISASTFVPVVPFVGNDSWTGLCFDQYNTLWTIDTAGIINTKTAFSSSFTYHGTAFSGARDITVAPNGDVYVCGPYNVWKQTGGVGAFVSLPSSPGYWMSLSAAPNGDIICSAEPAVGYPSGIWIIYAGTNIFIKIPCAEDVRWSTVHALASGQFYSSQDTDTGNGEIYKFG